MPAMQNALFGSDFSFSLRIPSVPESTLAVPASDAIFLRFRWGFAVWVCVFYPAVVMPASQNSFVGSDFSFSLGILSVPESMLAVPTSDAIFLRFRWGFAVLACVFFTWPWPCQQCKISDWLGCSAQHSMLGSAAWAVPFIRQCRVMPKAKQAICGFSRREAPPMSPTPEIGAG